MKTLSGKADGIVLAMLAALVALPCALVGETICFNAVTAEALEAPMEIATSTNAPMEIRDKLEKGAAGGAFLEIAQGKGYPPKMTSGMASFTFTVESEGDYYLWCRSWWLDECGNSFLINIDEAKPFIFGEDSTFKTWHWVKAPARLKQLTLTKGKHVLTFRNREDGVYLNQILLTSDKKYVPVDIETVTSSMAP